MTWLTLGRQKQKNFRRVIHLGAPKSTKAQACRLVVNLGVLAFAGPAAIEWSTADVQRRKGEANMKTFWLEDAYAFGAERGLEREIDEIKGLKIAWDKPVPNHPWTTSVRRGYLVALFEKDGSYEDFKKLYWPLGNTPEGKAMRSRYLSVKKQFGKWLLTKTDGRLPDDE
jgi:hypothetical protein